MSKSNMPTKQTARIVISNETRELLILLMLYLQCLKFWFVFLTIEWGQRMLQNLDQFILRYTDYVSETGDFTTMFFFWFGKTEADAAIAILLPTLKCFSCNGAVDWSTTCFWCKSVLQIRWQFCDRSTLISKRVRDLSKSCCSISSCYQDLGSTLVGCGFYTKEERW
jgi:hypothetical protein